jgi:hypothetical protein
MLAPLLAAGFMIEQVVEPQPLPEFTEAGAEDYVKLMRQPGCICFRVRKGQTA